MLVRDAYSTFVTWAAEEGFARKSLPAVNAFSQRIQASDPAISGGRNRGKRFLEGLRINASARASTRAGFGRGWQR